MSKGKIIIADASSTKKSCSKKWASLIKKIYEVTCPRCSHQMRIISIIEKPQTIQKILKHLNLWQPQTNSPPMCEENEIIEETIYDYNFFNYLPS
jgi:DNA-directed RNA polymerase subunit RPC12/RpoP